MGDADPREHAKRGRFAIAARNGDGGPGRHENSGYNNMLKAIVLTVGFGALVAAQTPRVAFDPDDLPRLKDFSAERVSSNNPDPESNDDSWRPIAGETVVLADLNGPGMVTHVWITVA